MNKDRLKELLGRLFIADAHDFEEMHDILIQTLEVLTGVEGAEAANDLLREEEYSQRAERTQ